ncbi:MAG: hypothetical protein H0X46_07380, partial [Bacteroidetes bacterium]|nr:hypothetical protein [Bacteroidota bacterium]
LLIACVFALKDLKQLDFFWMLRTGDWIIQNKSVPQTDILSYTFQGVEWLNIKWLFEVIIYYVNCIGGPELIPVLQLVINIVITIFIFKTVLLLKKIVGEKILIIPTVGIIVATYIYLFGTEYRMTGRPEMISHLMTLLYLFIYLSHRHNQSKIVFLLIPLQIIWTNCHDAFVNGCVMMIVFLISSLVEYVLYRKKILTSYKFSKQLFISCIIALLAVSINPKGLSLYTYPFKLFSSLNQNNFTQEFLSAFNSAYWTGKESYLLMISLILTLAAFLFYFKKSSIKIRFFAALQTFGLSYFILLLLFFYLALSAERNVVFFMVISAPLIALYLDNLIERLHLTNANKRIGYVVICLFTIILYCNVCNNSYYKAFNIPYQYGLSINKNDNPKGTVQYIKENNISGTCFSDYLTSSIFLWELRPNFKSYIDLRDLEVFTVPFFDEYNQMMRDPELFRKKDQQYGFDYALIYPNDFEILHKYLYNSEDWVLAYLEPACALYLKKNKTNAELIEGQKLKKGDLVFHPPLKYQSSKSATFISTLFWPFYRNKNINNNYDPFVKYFYQMVAIPSEESAPVNNKTIALKHIDKEEWKDAVFYLEESIKAKEEVDSYLLLAQCVGALHIQVENDKTYIVKWFEYMHKAYKLEPRNPRVRLMLGLAYCMDKKDFASAKIYLDGLENFDGMSQDEIFLLQKCKERCNVK